MFYKLLDRSYGRGNLLKSFDFTLGFCMPGSQNSWETIYSLPPVVYFYFNSILPVLLLLFQFELLHNTASKTKLKSLIL